MVVAGAFEDVERPVNLFSKHKTRQVMRENKFTEFDARVLASEGFGEAIGAADGEDDFAAGLRECFFYKG